MTIGRRRAASALVALALVAGADRAAGRLLAKQSLLSAARSADDQPPLVLVVHGVGTAFSDFIGNTPRSDGWSDDIARAWGVPVREITFRYPERTAGQAFTDLGSKAGEWAESVKSQIESAVKANPGRRVIVVSHSWGTVTTKLALAGGATRDRPDIRPMTGVTVDEWVTLGSPLGTNLTGLLGVVTADGRPAAVKHWSNYWDPADAVAKNSHALAGADNHEVNWRPSGLFDIDSAHSKMWTHERVTAWIGSQVAALRGPARPRTVEDVINEAEKERASAPSSGRFTQAGRDAAARCEADYLQQVKEINGNTQWNYSGLAGWDDGCPTADGAFTTCYERTCQLRRDGGISNACTEGCRATYRGACMAENRAVAAAQRDECVLRALR